MLTTWLLALIVGGLAGLVAPTDPATIYGRIGRWVRKVAALGVAAALVLGLLMRHELAAEFARMK